MVARVPFDEIPDNLSLRILLECLNNGPSVRSVLYARLGKGNQTVQAKLDAMIDSGLLVGRDESTPPKRKWVELTDKGRQVAEKLAEIEEILEG